MTEATIAVKEPIVETVYSRPCTTVEFCQPCKCYHVPGDCTPADNEAEGKE